MARIRQFNIGNYLAKGQILTIRDDLENLRICQKKRIQEYAKQHKEFTFDTQYDAINVFVKEDDRDLVWRFDIFNEGIKAYEKHLLAQVKEVDLSIHPHAQIAHHLLDTMDVSDTNDYDQDSIVNITRQHILNDSGIKKVVQELKQLVGEYDIKVCSVFKDDFIEEVKECLRHLVCCRSVYFRDGSVNGRNKEKVTMKSDEHKASLVITDIINALTNNTDYDTGCVTVGTNKVKILKYIRKELRSVVEFTDEEYNRLTFVRYYELNRTQNVQHKLVITDDILSNIGMSSYAPYRDEGTDRVWRSCMAIGDKRLYKGLIGNMWDTNSLIMYVTDGKTVPVINREWDKTLPEHRQMLARNVIRFGRDNNSNPIVMIDRSYPHDKYLEPMYAKLYDLCSWYGMKVTFPHYYNASQDDGSIVKRKYDFRNGMKVQHLYTQTPIDCRYKVKTYFDNNPYQFNNKGYEYSPTFKIVTPEYIEEQFKAKGVI